jgi:hypothetical protein
MTVDADITTEILRSIRDELRGLRIEVVDLRTEMRTGFSDLRDDIGALQLRMGTVERVVVAFSRELATLVGRVTNLEQT